MATVCATAVIIAFSVFLVSCGNDDDSYRDDDDERDTRPGETTAATPEQPDNPTTPELTEEIPDDSGEDEKYEGTLIDIDKMLKVDFGEYNGYATPSVSINYEYLDEMITDDCIFAAAEYVGRDLKESLINREYDYWFRVRFEKAYKHVSNGDILKVNISIDGDFEEYGITLNGLESRLRFKLSATEKSYTASGLPEPIGVLNFFEGFEQFVTFSGANGTGKINFRLPDGFTKNIRDFYFVETKGFDYTDENDITSDGSSFKIILDNTCVYKGVVYAYTGEKYLSKGDSIEFRLYGEEKITDGYFFSKEKVTLETPNLGKYFTSKDKLTPTVIQSIKEAVSTDDGDRTIKKLYYAKYNPGIECNYHSTSFIAVIVYDDSWLWGGYEVDYLKDIVIRPNGDVEVVSYSNDVYYSEDTLAEAEGELEHDKYTYELID